MDCQSGMVGREVKPAPNVSVSGLEVISSVNEPIPRIAALKNIPFKNTEI